jgi:hypothetical protein
MHRQFGTGLLAVDGNRVPRIIDAERGDRPAVIVAAPDQVDLVAASRTVLVGPELAGSAVEGKTLRVAMAIAPNLGARALPKAEKIVIGTVPSVRILMIVPAVPERSWAVSLCQRSPSERKR